MGDQADVTIRPRREDDLPGLVAALRLVHEADGYPIRWPEDPGSWVVPPRQRRGWVAVVRRPGRAEIVGHVAIDPSASDPAIGVASETTGLPVDSLAVIARTFVVPNQRRRRLGSALIATAVESARAEGLRAVLNVLESDRAAIALYEHLGWRRTGWLMLVSRHGEPLPSYVYVSPESAGCFDGQATPCVPTVPPAQPNSLPAQPNPRCS